MLDQILLDIIKIVGVTFVITALIGFIIMTKWVFFD
jgi:hypothetical protein